MNLSDFIHKPFWTFKAYLIQQSQLVIPHFLRSWSLCNFDSDKNCQGQGKGLHGWKICSILRLRSFKIESAQYITVHVINKVYQWGHLWYTEGWIQSDRNHNYKVLSKKFGEALNQIRVGLQYRTRYTFNVNLLCEGRTRLDTSWSK